MLKAELHAALVRRPLFLFALSFIAGLLIQSFFNFKLFPVLVLAVVLLLLALILLKKSTLIYIVIFLVGGMLRLAITRTPDQNDLRFASFAPDSTVTFEGVVLVTGQSANGKQRLAIDVYSLADSSEVTGLVWSYLRDPIPVMPGDTLIGRGFFRSPSPRSNPMDFDFAGYLAKNNVFWILYPDPKSSWNILPDAKMSLIRWVEQIRTRVAGYIHTEVPGQAGYMLSALLLGMREEVDDEIIQWFSETGVIHVLAVSGLHVGYVTLILMVIMSFLRLPYSLQVWGTVVGLLGYSLLTGGAPSVLRASTMATFYLIGTTIERRVDLYNLLGAAALGMLLIAPEQLWRVGFQLSFAAVFSIAYFFKRLKLMIPEAGEALLKRLKWLGYFVDLLLVSFAAQIGTLPFTIAYFHKIPIAGLFANLVVIPMIGIIVALGFTLLLLGTWIPLIGGMWAALLSLLLELLVKFVELMHRVPLAYISLPPIHPIWLIILIVTSLILFSTASYKRFILTIEMLLITNFLIWRGVWTAPPNLSIAILDVGQGDATIIQTPKGKTIVIDVGLRFGGDDSGADVVGPYLDYIQADTVDLLILTHPHNDHIGGAPWLLRHFPVKRVWQPNLDYDSFTYREIQFLIDSLGIKNESPFAGQVDGSFNPLFLRVLAPDSTTITNPPSSTNDYSIVVQTLYGTNRFLFSGDAEAGSETRQAHFDTLLKSDLIKVPHHGSLTSSTGQFLNKVKPQWAVISVGRRNKFRHPAKTTVERYQQLGVNIKRTDQDQAVIMEMDGTDFWLKQWRTE